jgi:hypothetical protein
MWHCSLTFYSNGSERKQEEAGEASLIVDASFVFFHSGLG